MARKAIVLLAAAFAMDAASLAFAQAKPEEEIRYRQSVMNVIGRSFGTLGAMAQGKIPFDAAAAAHHSAIVEMMSKLPWNSFGAGTDKGAPTKAATKIWSESDKFKEKADKMQSEVGKLATTAKGGDEGTIKAAVGDTGKACKGCHDDYRLKEFRN